MVCLEFGSPVSVRPPEINLIPFAEIVNHPQVIPSAAGTYLIFVRHGARLLETSGYFELSGPAPLYSRGRVHLYTGAASDLRKRLLAHITTNRRSSDFRGSLLALERECRAISTSRTLHCEVDDERSLSRWLRANAYVSYETCDRYDQYFRERELLKILSSPLNIQGRRGSPFARRLSEWRCRELQS
jgi:hypothetical protein